VRADSVIASVGRMELRAESLVVSAGRPHEPGAPLSTPIVLTAPYRNEPSDNRYSRHDVTDTVRAFETALGELEGGTAFAFASGMAAVAAVVEGRSGVTVLPDAAYAGALTLFGKQREAGRMELRPVDIADTSAVLAALDGADLLWLETLTNPMLAAPDLPVLIDAAHATGALVVVDATFSSPLVVRPLELGADIVMHSATKYLAGHSDLLMGALVVGSAALAEQVHDRRTYTGAVPGALESYLALRGLRTLALRMERAQANAGELAARLDAHPKVTRVRYPGLAADPGHEVATRVHHGYGAMISFEVAGTADDAEDVCQALRLITNATSLGGVESVIERRARHEVDAAFGTPPTLLRFSVGIEHVEDLWADLDQALSR
jgi:cystathionine gamma-synthase